MRKINTLLALLCILLITSCDSFLDVKPSNSADAGTSIKTVKDAQVIMNGLMRKMTSSSYYGRNFIMYGDAKGGDLAIVSQGRGLDNLYTFNHSATSGAYSDMWSQMYHCITQINNLMENIARIESLPGNIENFKQIKGEALTARALIYFDLVRLYGKPYNMEPGALGVPNVTTLLDATAQPLRATVKENYDQILKDLKAAESLLLAGKDDAHIDGYFSYYANLAIQARVYLYMDNFDEALKFSEMVINSKEYTLYTNNNWLSSWKNTYGSESILELAIFADEADLGTSSLGFYLMRQNKKKKALGYFMASDYFLARLGEDKTDVRWAIMDYDETSKTRLGCCEKYALGDKEGTATAVNIKVIRLSEIYLLAAEAALRSTTPNKAKAKDYLNEIRKRSPALAPATEATITLDMILDERSKELFAEGHRFFDMIRCNKTIKFNDDFIKPAVVITHRENTIDRTFYKCLLPISKGEIDANPAIASQQNPGY